jgi:hypothetical protein
MPSTQYQNFEKLFAHSPYGEMFTYGIKISSDFKARENDLLGGPHTAEPTKIIIDILDSFIAINGFHGTKFEENFLFQPLIDHAFSTLLGFDKKKYQDILPMFFTLFKEFRRTEIILASILEASIIKDNALERILFLYAVQMKTPKLPLLIQNATDILDIYHKKMPSQC